MNVLLNPEVWDVEKMEMLSAQRFNISGHYVVRDSALCLERISTDTEGTWYYDLEFKGETEFPVNKNKFPTFQNLIEFMDS